ncbi:MAG: ribosome biogenesis GTP-binding protein YihA/YsxC [Spirochaetes bacterium]|jgi:GTP-binding protein|nr:ribosome biogenesis GTP-binding protein YihA/YsxC [Spirochaetota bacterium]
MLTIRKSEFVKSVVGTNYPADEKAEFAFLGRSNSGKSSLINMLVNRKKLVKTGQTPGMTKMLNYFLINDSFHIVDMPGYGFAKVPISVKKDFQKLLTSYITERKEFIRILFLLMDIRRMPGEDEFFFLNLLAANNIPTALTLTKADKLSKAQQQKQIAQIIKTADIDEKNIFTTSTLKKSGKESILAAIEDAL